MEQFSTPFLSFSGISSLRLKHYATERFLLNDKKGSDKRDTNKKTGIKQMKKHQFST
jgi:hypothetical protein